MTVQTPKVALSDGFLGAFARIPKAQQKKVQEFISKFRQGRPVMDLTMKRSTMRAVKMSIRCESIKLIAALF